MSSPVSGFPLAGEADLNDLLHIVQDASDRRISVGDLGAALSGAQLIVNDDGTAVRFANGIQVAADQGSEPWSDVISRFSFGSTQSLADVSYVLREGSQPTYAAPFDSLISLQLQGGRPRSSDGEWVRIGAARPADIWAEQSAGFDSSVFVRWQYIAIGTWSE